MGEDQGNLMELVEFVGEMDASGVKYDRKFRAFADDMSMKLTDKFAFEALISVLTACASALVREEWLRYAGLVSNLAKLNGGQRR